MDWKFWIGSVIIPVATFVGGFFTGKTIEKRKVNKAMVKGNNNTVIQGNHYQTRDD